MLTPGEGKEADHRVDEEAGIAELRDWDPQRPGEEPVYHPCGRRFLLNSLCMM